MNTLQQGYCGRREREREAYQRDAEVLAQLHSLGCRCRSFD